MNNRPRVANLFTFVNRWNWPRLFRTSSCFVSFRSDSSSLFPFISPSHSLSPPLTPLPPPHSSYLVTWKRSIALFFSRIFLRWNNVILVCIKIQTRTLKLKQCICFFSYFFQRNRPPHLDIFLNSPHLEVSEILSKENEELRPSEVLVNLTLLNPVLPSQEERLPVHNLRNHLPFI